MGFIKAALSGGISSFRDSKFKEAVVLPESVPSEALAVKGVLLLVTYSLGLGAPFLLSALLIEKLNTAFTFIKKHYRVINIVCGCFLILVGILMACGLMDAITAVFS